MDLNQEQERQKEMKGAPFWVGRTSKSRANGLKMVGISELMKARVHGGHCVLVGHSAHPGPYCPFTLFRCA